ncbi:MAG: hypothetical protein EAZ34_01935 [Polaromonas sp.]|nr:MAG: hypothetical protein EAZ34_01935 [Polaromonas sp.]
MRDAHPAFVSTAFARAAVCAAWLLATSLSHAQTPNTSTSTSTSTEATSSAASDSQAELRDLLPQHKLLGKGRLTVWGFDVYDASLWVTPGFKADKLTALPFALELAYLRDFTNSDIAKRSIAEMRRSAIISEAQAQTWTAAMLRVIPDVKKGDRVTGVYRPGAGAAFLVNGKPAGEIMDAEFARLFFGIWLSPQTSEPKVRSALLAGTQ